MGKQALEAYPRVLVIQSITDREIAWVKPYAWVTNNYYSELPQGAYSEFGTEFKILVALKGGEVVVGDAFRTYNPNDTYVDTSLLVDPMIGDYVSGVERL